MVRLAIVMLAFFALLPAASAHAATVTVTAAWDANTESDLAGYKLSYGTKSGVYTTTIDVGKATSYPVSLTPGTTYFFAVQAYNTKGLVSGFSTEISYTIPAPGPSVPFGYWDTPTNNATGLVGSIAITGWALDQFGIDRVELWRNCTTVDAASSACATAPDGSTQVYIGPATMVAGARPDVAAAYPTLPGSDRAGFGYLLLTNLLPDLSAGTGQGGNGQFVLSAYAINLGGTYASLGTKTITVDNAHATTPFGAIDTPGQGATIPGPSAPYNDPNNYPMFGWAMTQNPKCMKTTDLTAYSVYIDGVSKPLTSSNFVRGLTRADLPAAFPGLCNSNNALAVYYLNASALGLSTGVHTLMWGIRDNGGNATNIGSRYFTLAATGGQSTAQAAEAPLAQSGAASVAPVAPLAALAPRAAALSASVNGAAPATVVPDAGGVARVQMPALGLLSLDLGGPVQRGYETAADGPHALPVGSTLDASRGRFYWQPGVGFFGPFHLVFVSDDATRTDVEVTIVDPTASGDVLLHIDTPQAMAAEHGGFTIAGWTLDPHAVSGSGVAAVHVWAYRRDVPGAAPQFLGAAAIGGPRADVAQAYGAQFDHAAWSLDVSSLAPGVYDLVVYSWSERTRDWAAATVVPVVVR